MSSKSDQNITGYKYSLSILMGLCRGPIEMIVQIKVADMVAWTGPLIQGAVQIPIYQPQLFGGDEAEGGVVGGFDFYDGNDGQFLPDTTKQIITSTNQIAVATSDGSQPIPLPPTDDDADSSTNDEAPSSGNPTIPITYQLEPVPVPELRGVATLWFDGQICSNNPYPKEWKIRIRRVLAGWDGDPWYPEAAVIPLQDQQALTTAATDQANVQASAAQDEQGNGDSTTNTTPASTAILLPESGSIYAMNPAHILYEIITNRDWGRGLDRTLIDDVSFSAAANYMLNEGFGLCLKWSKADDMAEFIQHLLDTMGAMLFTSRLTGLLTLKLIRADYNASELMTMDYNSGLLSVEDVSNTASEALVNEVIVKYHSPISNTDRQVRAQNLAGIITTGSVFSSTKEYPGIPTPDLAQRVAQRDLAAVAWGIRTFELRCDRRAYKIQPGDCFSLTAPDRNIKNTILRLLKLEDSTMTDGVLKLTCAQDVFGLPLTTFGQPQPVPYLPPNRDPEPVTYARLIEMTYRDAYLKLSTSDLAGLGPGQTGFVVLPAQPTSFATGYRLKVSTNGGGMVDANVKAFSQFVRMKSAIGKYDTQFTLIGFPAGFQFSLPACLMVDDEFMRVDSLDVYSGLATVGRGVVDSLPQRHAAGAVAWFYDTGSTDQIEYAVGETVTVYEQTRTTKGLLPLDQMPGVTMTFAGRQERPYPPANVTINGPYAQDSDTGVWTITAKDLTINFARRNRLTLADQMVGFSDADMVPETGQTTVVRIRRMKDNAVIGTYPGITGTQFVYTQAQALTDGAYGSIQVELYSVRGGIVSKYAYIYPLNYYPAAAAATGSKVGVSVATISLLAVQSGKGVTGATMLGRLLIINQAATGSVSNTGQSTAALTLTDGGQFGSTLGGVFMQATLNLSSALIGSAPAIGPGHGSFTITSRQGDPVHNAGIGSFAMTALQAGRVPPMPGMLATIALTTTATGTVSNGWIGAGTIALTATQAGGVAATGQQTASLTLTSGEGGQDTVTGTSAASLALTAAQSGVRTATGSSTGGFALTSSDTGQDIATGISNGNLALTSAEAGGAAATGQQSRTLAMTSSQGGAVAITAAMVAGLKLTAIEASSQIAAMYQNANLALTSGPNTGTVGDSGTSTGNLALTAAQAGSAPAIGSSTGNFALTASDTGSDPATGSSTGNFALTSAEAGTVPNTVASTGNFRLTSAEAGSAPATGTSTGNAALTSADTGTVQATGTSAGNLALTSADTGTAPATGTSTGSVKLTSTETGTAGASGYGKSYGTKYGS